MNVSALIHFLEWLVIVGIVFYIFTLLLARIPMDATFKQVAYAVLALIAVLILLQHVLPLLGVSL